MESQSESPKWIDRLFLRLAAIYGAEWIDKWRDAPIDLVKAEWERGLSRYSLPTLKLALDYCAANLKFPPTLPGFIVACQQVLPRAEAEIRRPRLVNKPDAEFVQAKIAEMKMVLGARQ